MDDSTNTHQHHLWTQIYSDHLWAVLHHPWQLAAVTPCWTNFYEANVLPCCCIPAFSWQNFWRLVGLAQRTSTAWNKNQWNQTNQQLLTPLLELQGQPFGNLYTPSICLSLRSKHGQTALHKALVESSLLVQFWRLLRSRWASSWSTMVLKKNTPRLRNNIQSNAKTASALTAHWCVEASVFTDGLMGHGVYRPSSSFTIQVPDSSSPLISLSCQYSSKVMSHSWLSWFTTRLLILMVDISIGGWGSGPTQKWGGTTLCWCEDFPLSSHQLPEKKTDRF